MADWQYIVLKPAQKYLAKMPLEDQIRLVEALDTLITDVESVDLKPFKGRSEWRLRVGKYRVLLLRDVASLTYIITVLGPRGDVYK